jgi:antitoxin component YwqK of YwqJK toxin-antitoxin module
MEIDLTKTYACGQPVSALEDATLTFFYKNGQKKAEGPFVDGMMEGTWRFYRYDGALWQTGNFKNEQKHGRWTRYDREGVVEYDEEFFEGKKVKK